MTLNEIAVLIAERAKRQFDEPFRDMIKDRLLIWRATHIRRALEKDPGRRKFFLQSVTMKLSRKKAVECGIPLDCWLAETELEVPAPITANKLLYEYVGSVEGSNAFSWVERSWLKFRAYDKYASKIKAHSYTALNKRIQVYDNENLPYILVEGVFENPEYVEQIRCSNNGVACNYGDTEFNAPMDIIQLCIQSILEIDLRVAPDVKKPEDEVQVTENNE